LRNRLRTPLEDCGQAKRRACHHRKRIGLRTRTHTRRGRCAQSWCEAALEPGRHWPKGGEL